MLFPDTVTFRVKAWIRISIDTFHTSKLLCHVSLLPLNIKQIKLLIFTIENSTTKLSSYR